MGHHRTFSGAASNDRFVAATGHWKLKLGISLGSFPVPYLIVRNHDGLELPGQHATRDAARLARARLYPKSALWAIF